MWKRWMATHYNYKKADKKKQKTHKRFIPSSKVLVRDCESYILYWTSVLNPKSDFSPQTGWMFRFSLSAKIYFCISYGN